MDGWSLPFFSIRTIKCKEYSAKIPYSVFDVTQSCIIAYRKYAWKL